MGGINDRFPRCRVVQVTMGRFNQFDVAQQTRRHGILERLIPAYPHWEMRGEGLPDEAIASFPSITLVGSAAVRAGLARGWLTHELA